MTPSQQSSARPDSHSATTPFESVLNALEWTFDELLPTKKGCTTLGMLNKLYFCFRTPAYKDKSVPSSHKFPVEDIIGYNAKELAERLDRQKWKGHEIYDSYILKRAKEDFQPKAMKMSDFPFTLVPRESRPRVSSASVADPSSQTRPMEVDSDDEPGRFTTPRRGKALKGPRPSQSGLRVPSKRRHNILDDSSDTENDTSKRSHVQSDDEDMEDADTSERYDQAPDDTPIKLVIRADRIPSATPRGPNNTWTCEEEDCDFIVRGGDEEECQQRIEEHFREHEQDADRVSLALTEGRGQRIEYAYFPPFLILVYYQSG